MKQTGVIYKYFDFKTEPNTDLRTKTEKLFQDLVKNGWKPVLKKDTPVNRIDIEDTNGEYVGTVYGGQVAVYDKMLQSYLTSYSFE